jgi:hypothetical protein
MFKLSILNVKTDYLVHRYTTEDIQEYFQKMFYRAVGYHFLHMHPTWMISDDLMF